jgi:xylan 1,4-beta-xylosidase
MGSPAHPTPEQLAQLEKAGQLEQTVPDHKISLEKGKAEISLSLPRQGVLLVRLQEK